MLNLQFCLLCEIVIETHCKQMMFWCDISGGIVFCSLPCISCNAALSPKLRLRPPYEGVYCNEWPLQEGVRWSNGIANLSEDLWISVFRFLGLEDLSNASLCCCAWRDWALEVKSRLLDVEDPCLNKFDKLGYYRRVTSCQPHKSYRAR